VFYEDDFMPLLILLFYEMCKGLIKQLLMIWNVVV